jgi:signal transduction histidine kinase
MPSSAGRMLVDYSALIMAATIVAILNAVHAAANPTLFWSFLIAGIGLWLVDMGLWVRFHVEFPERFRLLVALTAVGFLGFFLFTEISRRQRAERSQLEGEERLRLAAQAGRMYAYEWDAVRDVIVRSPECSQVLGSLTELLDHTFGRMLAQIDAEDRERFAAAIRNLSPEKSQCQISYRVTRSDESPMWLEESARAFFDSRGRMLRVIGMVADVTARKNAERELVNLSARFVTAQEQERTRIARELHDDLSQRLALVAVTLESLGQNPPKSKLQMTVALHEMWCKISEISSDVHHLSRQLHPSTLGLGLGSALKTLCGGVERQHGLKLTVSCNQVPDALPSDVALCLYRVAQEAISNVVKHGNVQEATLELVGDSGHLSLRVIDRGQGFEYDAANEHGLGLLSMRERLRLVGGALTVRSRLSEGTEIVADVPVEHAALALTAKAG